MAVITVPFDEKMVTGLDQNTYTRDTSGTATRVLICDHDLAPKLCQELLGFVQQAGSSIQSLTLPAQHPNRPELFVLTASFMGIGVPDDRITKNANGTPRYKKAEVTVEYGFLELQGDINNNAIITETRDFSVSIQTVPGNKFRWDDSDNFPSSVSTGLINKPLGILIPETIVGVQIENWINAPIDQFDNEVGKINNQPILFVQTTFDTHTLLFEGANSRRTFTPTGVSGWNVSLKFKHRPSTWRRIVNKDGQLQRTTPGIYQESDFSAIFKPF